MARLVAGAATQLYSLCHYTVIQPVPLHRQTACATTPSYSLCHCAHSLCRYTVMLTACATTPSCSHPVLLHRDGPSLCHYTVLGHGLFTVHILCRYTVMEHGLFTVHSLCHYTVMGHGLSIVHSLLTPPSPFVSVRAHGSGVQRSEAAWYSSAPCDNSEVTVWFRKRNFETY